MSLPRQPMGRTPPRSNVHSSSGRGGAVKLPGVRGSPSRGRASRLRTPEGYEDEPNPFVIPNEDIFMMREREKAEKHAEKIRQSKLKVWQKTSSHHQRFGSTRARFSAPRRRADVGTKDKPDRKREKENMAEFISKKREMFLTQMSLNTKREEIKILEEKAAMKEDALEKSEQLLQNDATRFGHFLNQKDKMAHEALKKTDKETKDRQEKQQEIKKYLAEINKYQNECQKKDDTLKRCREYKEFLDNLSPPEWKENQRIKKEERRLAKIQTRIAAGLPEEDPDASSSEEEMYFKHPDELLAKFTQLEERCLFLIEKSQQSEEALEEMRTKFAETTVMLKKRTQDQENNIKELELKIAEERAHGDELRQKTTAGLMKEEDLVLLEALKKRTAEVYKKLDFQDSTEPMFMLRDMEGMFIYVNLF